MLKRPKNIHFSATEASPHSAYEESPQTSSAQLSAGWFNEGPRYEVVRPRGAGSWLLILTLDGEGELETRKGVRPIRPGDIVLWEPKVYQRYATAPQAVHWEILWVHFQPRAHWPAFMSWPTDEIGLRRTSLDLESSTGKRFVSELKDIVRAGLSDEPLSEALANAYLEAWLIRMQQSFPQADLIDPRIKAATEWAHRHLHRPIRVQDLADRAGLSLSRFSHLFRERIGSSPREFLESAKMAVARQRLAMTNHPIKQIAHELGFESEFYFSHRFRHHFGQSPTEYRKSRQIAEPVKIANRLES